jgi:hypothetical protein
MKIGLVGALESGLVRGETLKRAMMTLYNAGYLKKDIEEAAGLVKNKSTNTSNNLPVGKQSAQNISNYEKIIRPKINTALVMILLGLLVCATVLIFLFREGIMRFLNDLLN